MYIIKHPPGSPERLQSWLGAGPHPHRAPQPLRDRARAHGLPSPRSGQPPHPGRMKKQLPSSHRMKSASCL